AAGGAGAAAVVAAGGGGGGAVRDVGRGVGGGPLPRSAGGGRAAGADVAAEPWAARRGPPQPRAASTAQLGGARRCRSGVRQPPGRTRTGPLRRRGRCAGLRRSGALLGRTGRRRR